MTDLQVINIVEPVSGRQMSPCCPQPMI